MRKKLIVAAAFAALLAGCATYPTAVFEPFQAQDLNPLLTSNQYSQKVDNFFVLNDSSDSMSDKFLGTNFTAQPEPNKFAVEKEILSRINQTIPNLAYTQGWEKDQGITHSLTSSVRSFGFGPCLDQHFTKLNQEPVAYSKATFSAGIDALECSGGGSPLDDGLAGTAQDLANTQGNIAVLVVSDGHDLDNYGTKQIADMKAQYGDRLCVYGVWVGNPEETSGLAVLNQLSSIAGCGFAVSSDQLATSEGVARFVKSIFLKPDPHCASDYHLPYPACNTPNRVVDVEFNNDKFGLKDSTLMNSRVNGHRIDTTVVQQHLADMVNSVIRANPNAKFELHGHTNYTGKESRNIELGIGRARTVHQYMIDNYPDIAQQLAEPQGFSWNCTKAGLDPRDEHNRRVEVAEAGSGCNGVAISTQELKARYGHARLGGKHHHHKKHRR